MNASPKFLILLIWLQCIIIINSITDSWPRFYHLGESTHPTQSILNNLTFYRSKWQEIQKTEGFEQTYAFTMAWDCSPCDECYQANKFLNVVDDVIVSLQTSELNDDSKKTACSNVNNTKEITEYKTIDELYTMLIDWVQSGLDGKKEDYLIIELMLHKDYLFPMAVKLSERTDYIAWDIPCFEPCDEMDDKSPCLENEENVCDYTSTSNETEKKWTFWITKEMQSFLGWSMIFLILVACSLGYCINWLKKKKSEKIEAWREKEEKQREERLEREREKAKKKGKKKNKGRKGSKSKHRAHLEKQRKQRANNRNANKSDYSNVPIMSNLEHSSDSEQTEDHYDIQEEQI